jgi:hypothetical protein
MNYEDIESRIEKVNDKLWDFEIESGSTHLWRYDFNERERKVFDLFEDVMEKYAPHIPPPDVLARINLLLDAMRSIYVTRCVDVFADIVGIIIYTGRSDTEVKFDKKLLEMRLWNLVFREARDFNEERAFDNAVVEVFGTSDWDLLPDTEADPLDPGWDKVEAITDEYRLQRDIKEKKEEEEFKKSWKK